MKRKTFIQGVVVAALLAMLASVVVAALVPFVGTASVFRMLVPSLGFVYLCYLLSGNAQKLGRITTLGAWLGIAAITWWVAPPLLVCVLIHAASIWFVRALYFYSGLIPALIDLGLSAMSVLLMVWAASQSDSVLLTTWCFFLVQALCVAIPRSISRRSRDPQHIPHDGFERARRQADAALRQLFSQ